MNVTEMVQAPMNGYSTQSVIELESLARQARAVLEKFRSLDVRDVQVTVSLDYNQLRARFTGTLP